MIQFSLDVCNRGADGRIAFQCGLYQGSETRVAVIFRFRRRRRRDRSGCNGFTRIRLSLSTRGVKPITAPSGESAFDVTAGLSIGRTARGGESQRNNGQTCPAREETRRPAPDRFYPQHGIILIIVIRNGRAKPRLTEIETDFVTLNAICGQITRSATTNTACHMLQSAARIGKFKLERRKSLRGRGLGAGRESETTARLHEFHASRTASPGMTTAWIDRRVAAAGNEAARERSAADRRSRRIWNAWAGRVFGRRPAAACNHIDKIPLRSNSTWRLCRPEARTTASSRVKRRPGNR